MRIKIAMYLAFIGGIIVPLLETVRRWNQLSDVRYFMAWFDDYILGGFLIFGAYKVYKSVDDGQKYLSGAWGFATGMAFCSFFLQLQSLDAVDPAPVSSMTVAVVKGIMLAGCLVCLVFSWKGRSMGK